jgi:acetyl esterase/lipase
MTTAIPAIDEGRRELAGDLDEVRETNRMIEELMSGVTDMETPEGLDAARKFIVELMGDSKPEIVPQIRSDAGVPVRVFVPAVVDAVYLHIHGGGFAIGVAAMNDVSNSEIAKTCNFAVVSVDYRLAPEHPYPAGPDDCEAVARWLIDNAESEFGTSKLLIGGESAGGNLATVTLLRVRDKVGAADRFFGANLVYGVYDMSGAPSSRNADDKSLVLKRSDMEAFGRLYLGHEDIESRLDPDVSPLYADLSGLPPALFTVGGADPLLDDSLFMAARWQVAGNHSELAFYPECPHGFDMFPTKAGMKAHARQMQWMAARVEQAGS